jgi:biopolymer transport protein ExbD
MPIRRPAAASPLPSWSLTSMIDVVFLLLIFFVCTAGFQPPEFALPGALPPDALGAEAGIPPEPRLELERIVVTLAAERGTVEIRVNDQPCASLVQLRALLDQLARIDATLPVTLDVGPRVPFGVAIDACDASRLAGFQEVQFAAQLRE